MICTLYLYVPFESLLKVAQGEKTRERERERDLVIRTCCCGFRTWRLHSGGRVLQGVQFAHVQGHKESNLTKDLTN